MCCIRIVHNLILMNGQKICIKIISDARKPYKVRKLLPKIDGAPEIRLAEQDIPLEELFREDDAKTASRRKCKVMDILFERQRALDDEDEDLANIGDIEVPKPVSLLFQLHHSKEKVVYQSESFWRFLETRD